MQVVVDQVSKGLLCGDYLQLFLSYRIAGRIYGYSIGAIYPSSQESTNPHKQAVFVVADPDLPVLTRTGVKLVSKGVDFAARKIRSLSGVPDIGRYRERRDSHRDDSEATN